MSTPAISSPLPTPPLPSASPAPSRCPSVPLNATSLGDVLELSIFNEFPDGRGNYVAPTPAQQDRFSSVVSSTLQGLRQGDATRLAQARQEAGSLGYRLSEIQEGDQRFLALSEMGPLRGWPTVVFNIHPGSGVVIEAPHPAFDLSTPELAWRAFKAFRADVYIVAGAHRANRTDPSPDVPVGALGQPFSVSDPTHTRATMFQAAHQGATGEGSTVVQFHGFSAAKHHHLNPDFPEDMAAVLSDAANDHYNPPTLLACAEALQGAGYKSHVVAFEGPLGNTLSAVDNVQHKDMQERGLVGPGQPGEFVHIEFDSHLRMGEARDAHLDRIVDALRPIFLDEA